MKITLTMYAFLLLLFVFLDWIVGQVASQCVPGIVTCCLTVSTNLAGVYVNNQDLTWMVTPASARANANAPKFVSFIEPMTPAVIAIKGEDRVKKLRPGFQLRCTCTRPGSLWNFASSTREGWKMVQSSHAKKDKLPAGWFTNGYAGSTSPITSISTDKFSLAGTSLCGSVLPQDKLRLPTNRKFFGTVKAVNSACSSPQATLQPISSSPTSQTPTALSPTSSSPTGSAPVSQEPASTQHPSSFAPTIATESPSATVEPTAQDSTSMPSSQSPSLVPSSTPSKAPSSSRPSSIPTSSRPSRSPSLIPSLAPSKVPSLRPSSTPTTSRPSRSPSKEPSLSPVRAPSRIPSWPTLAPSHSPGYRKFKINLVNITDVTEEQATAFQTAAARWEEIIIEDFGSYAVLSQDFPCPPVYTFLEGTVIRDITIAYAIVYIDGPGLVLGSAGPCAVDDLNRPRLGTMRFDSADVTMLIGNALFTDVVLHEMGHVLGIGTMWNQYVARATPSPTIVSATRTPTKFDAVLYYAGVEGNIGNNEIGLTGPAVIEDTGGQGTRGGHWKESVYDDELMTGYAEPTGKMPISKLTVRALRDLGYMTDLSKADNYTLPSNIARRLARGKPRTEFHNDIHRQANLLFLETTPDPGREKDNELITRQAWLERRQRNGVL